MRMDRLFITVPIEPIFGQGEEGEDEEDEAPHLGYYHSSSPSLLRLRVNLAPRSTPEISTLSANFVTYDV